jgi:hypothetical protein
MYPGPSGRRARARSCNLQEIRADKAIEVAVEHALDVPDLEVRAVILHELVRVQDIAAHRVAAEAHVDTAALAGELRLALLDRLLGEA